MSFGLETEIAYPGDALYFWASPERYPEGMAWLFPVGNGSRIGLASYAGVSVLKGALARLVDDLGATPTAYHGTYFPSRLRRPTVGRLFVAGDAAGQCLPFTGEGIRPALHFGQECGRVIQRVLDGTLTLEQAREAYRQYVGRYRSAYRFLRFLQWLVASVPKRWLGPLIAFEAHPRAMARWWPRYSRFGRLAPLAEPLEPIRRPEGG